MTTSNNRLGLSDKQIADAAARALKKVHIPQGPHRVIQMTEADAERMEKHVARFRKVFKKALRNQA